MSNQKSDPILIFHHNGKQHEGVYWLILCGGRQHFVASWEAQGLLESVQAEEDVVHVNPLHYEGRTQLPRFYLRFYGGMLLDTKRKHAILKPLMAVCP